MGKLAKLIENNQNWATQTTKANPDFFKELAAQQTPKYLWIGCSDSRVPANQITGLKPGEVFVHRNIANMVVHTDLNCLSVLQYAVDILKVEEIIVCGHYGCGGVHAAMHDQRNGLVDYWLRHVKDVRDKHLPMLDALKDDHQRRKRLVELNVMQQVFNLSRTNVLQDAWERGQKVGIHSWVYGLHNGLINDLNFRVRNHEHAKRRHAKALSDLDNSNET
ncbi:MAG: carbonate dehydratase [Saccharospirillaceae bacterium]|nr:carbonate dehydratase [Pseudomonadales bacterium]NRB81701.1 carbonate dehydratase [Saccharospirillaceae bacterium]